MERMFTWSGRSFGYKDGENLWTYSGKHVGKFHGDEVYGPDARYLGACPRIRSWRRNPPRNNLLTAIWTLSWSN